jgi:translation initiation factor 2D
MFRKDFKSKGHTQVKSSDRKKLRQQLQDIYPVLNDEALSWIVPTGKGDDLTSCKLVLSTGDDVIVYSTNKIPWLFLIEDKSNKTERILPTVYLLWKCPDLLPLKFHTHRQVFNKLLNGADLMLPGLILPSGGVTPQTFRHVKRDNLCSICLDDNRYPIGIGQTTMDGEDMYMSGMKGRGVIVLHIYQDSLWNFGPRTEGPYERQDMPLFVTDQGNVEQACAQISSEIQQITINDESEVGECRLSIQQTIE